MPRIADPRDEIFFDAATTQMRGALVRKAIAAGKAIYCEKPTSDNLPEALELARLAKAAGIKHGVVQDKLFPARPAQAENGDRQRLLRPDALGARGIRLLGVRRRSAAGAAAKLELQKGRGRRHHPRYAVPLALRAGQSVRRDQGRVLPRRHPHPEPRRRSRQALRRRRRRCRLRHLPAGRRRDRADQPSWMHAGAARRSGDVPCGRHPRLRGRGPARNAGRRRG